jgi:hypothetical protein
MASLSSPIGPTIDVVARTVSRSVISGGAGGGGGIPGGGGGRGGALAVQPQASLVNVERNLEVQTVQNVQQTQEISALRGTVDALRAETTTLNNGLGNVSNLIQQDSAVEKQQASAEAESERKLAETNIRLGKESQLEQKITNALAKPVQALQQKVGNIFGRIGEALTALFAGWLTNQGIEALKAASEGNKNKLEEIICDADLDYLGRDDFHEIADRLRRELKEHGKIESDRQWDEIQVKFLTSHKYFTQTAIDTRRKKKLENLADIKSRLEKGAYDDE